MNNIKIVKKPFLKKIIMAIFVAKLADFHVYLILEVFTVPLRIS